MSLEHVVKVAGDGNLHQRLIAEAAKQGVEDPTGWVLARAWKFAVLPTWADKYDSAEQNQIGVPIGTNSTVFTDGDIASGVAAIISAETP